MTSVALAIAYFTPRVFACRLLPPSSHHDSIIERRPYFPCEIRLYLNLPLAIARRVQKTASEMRKEMRKLNSMAHGCEAGSVHVPSTHVSPDSSHLSTLLAQPSSQASNILLSGSWWVHLSPSHQRFQVLVRGQKHLVVVLRTFSSSFKHCHHFLTQSWSSLHT